MQPPRWKMAIVIWLGIYPTATAVFWLLQPFIKDFPLLLKTFCLNARHCADNGVRDVAFLDKNIKGLACPRQIIYGF
jgi:hypothetical protein